MRRPSRRASAPDGKSGIAGRNGCRRFDHQNYCSFRGARAMDDSPRYDKTLLPVQLNTPVLEIDNEATVEDKEELIIVVVLMPMILTLQDAKPNDRVVDLAERLVIPAVGTRFDQRRNVHHAQG